VESIPFCFGLYISQRRQFNLSLVDFDGHPARVIITLGGKVSLSVFHAITFPNRKRSSPFVFVFPILFGTPFRKDLAIVIPTLVMLAHAAF